MTPSDDPVARTVAVRRALTAPGHSPRMRPLLDDVRRLWVDGREVIFVWPAEHPFMLDLATRRRKEIEDIVHDALGPGFRVHLKIERS